MIKNFIILLLLISSIIAKAQETSDGFWGIPLGWTKQDVITHVKTTKKLLPQEDSDGDLLYENVVFAGRKSCDIFLCFNNNRFYKGIVFFHYQNMENAIKEYKIFKDKLKEKYGPATFEQETLPSGIGSSDYYEIEESIKKGEAVILSRYITKDKSQKEVLVELGITDIPALTMFYVDKKLKEEIIQKIKEKQQKDF